jgi:hypothetical protein
MAGCVDLQRCNQVALHHSKDDLLTVVVPAFLLVDALCQTCITDATNQAAVQFAALLGIKKYSVSHSCTGGCTAP